MKHKTRTRTVSQKTRKAAPWAFELLANIDAQKGRTGASDEDLCMAMRKSSDTLYRRRKSPWSFTVQELSGIAGVFGVSLWELFIPQGVVDKIIADHAVEIAEAAQKLLKTSGQSA